MTYTGRILDSAGNPTGGRVIAFQLCDTYNWYKDDRRDTVIVNPTTGTYSITVDEECYLVIIPEINVSNAKVVSQGVVLDG